MKIESIGTAVALELDHFEEAVEHLRSHEVKFALEPFETPVCLMAAIQDLNGSKNPHPQTKKFMSH